MGANPAALAHARLSARQLAQGAHGAAFESIAAALGLAPDVDAYWTQFADVIRYFNLRHPVPAMVRELLARALEHPAVDPGNLVRPITTLALSQANAFREPLLLRLMEDVVIRDAALERLIVETRRRMLDEALPLPVMNAIAHQCFNTEYVFDETAAETARLPAVLDDEESIARYAAYRPLGDKTVQGSALVRRHIVEPEEERRLAAAIPSLATTENEVSARVQAQYESHPYPRWVRTQTAFAEARMPGLPDEPRILIAGCGTGQQAIQTARRFPRARVLAIDISRSSLAYAMRKTRELGVQNIEYAQADILGLRALDERFHLVECTGVLHHLEDPFEGWRILASLRQPGGLMRVALYSEAGRRSVVRAREVIAAEGLKPDAAGIRACRAMIRARADDPLLAELARNEDFFSMSGCRDLLFHEHEVRFTLPQIAEMMARLQLRFLGFELADSGETLARFGARYSDPRHLQSWHQFEQKFPATFARMYQFWAS